MPTKTRLCDNAKILHFPAGALSVRFLPTLPLLSTRQALPRSPVHRLSASYRYPLSPHTKLTFQATLASCRPFFEESASLPADPSVSHSERIRLHSEDRSLPAFVVRLFQYPTCLVLFGQPIDRPVKEKKCILRATLVYLIYVGY